jgi:Ca2+-dependent lipid-binding protein
MLNQLPSALEESVVASDSGFVIMDNAGKPWSVQRELRVEDIEILKGSSKVVEVKVGTGQDTVVRDFKFHNSPDAETFENGLAKVKELEKERSRKQIASYKESARALNSTKALNTTKKLTGGDAGHNPATLEEINLLVEIVSAVNLPKADIGGAADPYCIVTMAGKEIHRTKVIKQNLQPIWTLETGSMFVILSTPEVFFASSSGISFAIKDYDIAGAHDLLATVSVPLNVALDSTGDRTEYSMVLDKAFAKKGTKAPSLFLRIKPASKDDIEVWKD